MGGNGDYYLTLSRKGPWGRDGFRACTSGARSSALTSLVASMYFLGAGDNKRAADIARIAAELMEDRAR